MMACLIMWNIPADSHPYLGRINSFMRFIKNNICCLIKTLENSLKRKSVWLEQLMKFYIWSRNTSNISSLTTIFLPSLVMTEIVSAKNKNILSKVLIITWLLKQSSYTNTKRKVSSISSTRLNHYQKSTCKTIEHH